MTDLFRKAEESGIIVEYLRLPINESLSVESSEGDFVLLDYSLINACANERVHLAHELGHCVKGSFYNTYTPYNVRQKHENRADKWAIEELIPLDDFDLAISEGYTDLWSLAEYFGVTEDFMRKAACWHIYGNIAAELYF